VLLLLLGATIVACGSEPKTDGTRRSALVDPITEMGSSFDIDIDDLPVRKDLSSPGVEILFEPIPVVAPSKERENPERSSFGWATAEWSLYGTFRRSEATDVDGAAFDPPSPAGSSERTDTSATITDDSDGYIVGFPETGRMYRVARPRTDFQTIRAVYEELGRNRGWAPESANPGGPEPALQKQLIINRYSDSTDDRRIFGAYEGDEWNHGGTPRDPLWPVGTIGQMHRGNVAADATPPDTTCTATFVGPTTQRYVITAAHCVMNDGWLDLDFVPRKDGCEWSTEASATEGWYIPGWPVPGCDRAPFGKWDGAVWMMPQAWVDNCVARADRNARWEFCREHDIAVVEMFPEAGASFPGAMGFVAHSSGELADIAPWLFSRGYPSCTTGPNIPTICRPTTLYGDVVRLGFFRGRLFAHSSDSSPGHSGGPFWNWDCTVQDVAVGPCAVFVWGVITGQGDAGSNYPLSTPYTGARIDGPFYSWMLDFMNL
jgi:hypothetical protein